jgi:NhaA family Na+:H+ antiporter
MSGHTTKRGVYRTLVDNSFLLIAGTLLALFWANGALNWKGIPESLRLTPQQYEDFLHFDVLSGWNHSQEAEPAIAPQAVSPVVFLASPQDLSTTEQAVVDGLAPDTESQVADAIDHDATDASESITHGQVAQGGVSHQDSTHAAHHGLTIHFIINDILMALFFAKAAKEVWESLLPGGALANPRKAATPLLATLGGVVGPALVYLAGCSLTDTHETLGRGWAVPCATDIAFSYMVARVVFGVGHPAIAFLLLLAIADDAAGLAILAVFYPAAPVVPAWLLLTVAAMAITWGMRKARIHSHWAYLLIPGILCWLSFYKANIHAALGLVPIIPLLPHVHTDLGIFAREELHRRDTLSEFEHFWKTPVEYILFLFGLANAGVVFSSLGTGTWLVVAGLLVGKPIGITLLTLFAEKVLGLEKPAGMDYRHVLTMGMVAGIGFTVALFVSVAAFTEPGALQDSVKMGALLSFLAAPIGIVMGKMLGIKPWRAGVNLESQ